jgi:hypothetical protein
MTPLLLTYEDNGSAQADVVELRLENGFEGVGDSYFFGASYLDDAVLGQLPELAWGEMVRFVMRKVLQDFRSAIAVLAPGASAYLPYCLEDQHSEWLRASLVDDDEVELLPVQSSTGAGGFSLMSSPEFYTYHIGNWPVGKDIVPFRLTRA